MQFFYDLSSLGNFIILVQYVFLDKFTFFSKMVMFAVV